MDISRMNIKLNLNKFTDAVINEGWLCIPIPEEGTGANGLFHGKNGAIYADTTCFVNDEEDDYGQHGRLTVNIKNEDGTYEKMTPIVGNIKVMA